jgi:gliding motility-associated protein GldL
MGIITNIVTSKAYKIFMARLYGWGASIVMIGALMKLEHMQYSSYFLIAGLGTEALIFFFSAWEPTMENYAWDRIYPELANGNGKKKKEPVVRGSQTQQLDQMFSKADITPEVLQKLGNGMRTLADTTTKISEISDAHVVTQDYIGSVKNAAGKLESFSDAYGKSTQELNKSATSLTNSYTKTAEMVAQTGSNLVETVNRSSGQLSESYNQLLAAINKDYAKLNKGSSSNAEQLDRLNKNLSALNTVYELQLKGSDAHLQSSKEVYAGLDSMMENLVASVDNTKLYRSEVESLGRKLISLNKVYGNMLTAMNMREDV